MTIADRDTADQDDDLADDDTIDDDVADDDIADDDSIPPPPGCDTLYQGWNEGFMVDGVGRSFYLDLPAGIAESWPWPVVFNWHGFTGSVEGARAFVIDLVDNEDFPFIAVTPEDTGLELDWDVLEATNPYNREARLFDALLAELDRCWGVDRRHVHTMGFSAGGGVSDMLGVLRGDIIASIGTLSGFYASNPANTKIYELADWPPLTTTNLYAEMRIHGGESDWALFPTGEYAENDRLYLNERGHDVVICNHGMGHHPCPPQVNYVQLVEFFADHPLGTYDSPYAGGFPDDFPSICKFSPKNH